MPVTVIPGDAREILPTLAADSVDACVTDPPYGIKFMGKRWDSGEAAFDPVFWAEVLRVLRPGAHLIAFGGTRTYHRLACAIEDAGFEIRDQIGWAFGSGFPKSHDVSKGIDKAAGAERRPVAKHRVTDTAVPIAGGDGSCSICGRGRGGQPGNCQCPKHAAPATEAAAQWQGWGTALKPAWEPIVLARKPLIGTVAANVLAHGTGALNIDGCRVATDDQIHVPQSDPAKRAGIVGGDLGISSASVDRFQAAQRASIERTMTLGRWPANLIHDGSDEVLAAFPNSPGQQGVVTGDKGDPAPNGAMYADSGSAARFFYCAKASTKEREGSKHPTVKPIALTEYLVRLVTPPGGLVLDPFAGSGTTGVACMRKGFDAILIEREAAYLVDIERRLGQLSGSDTPLFADR